MKKERFKILYGEYGCYLYDFRNMRELITEANKQKGLHCALLWVEIDPKTGLKMGEREAYRWTEQEPHAVMKCKSERGTIWYRAIYTTVLDPKRYENTLFAR